jgi:hypothetical protein
MIQSNFASSQSFQNCEAHKEQLIQEIEQLTIELKKTSEVKKYTSEIKKKMAKLEQKIRSNQEDLEKVEVMLTFVPGQWVRNGTTRPGQITELRIVGRIPEVQVLWWNNTASVPENPRHLKLVQPDDLRYVWNGQRCPKLIRKIDHEECQDLEILGEIYQELESFEASKEVNLKLVYCRKRLELLSGKKFPSSQETKENSILNLGQSCSSVSPTRELSVCHRKPELQTIAIIDINRSGQTQQRIGLNPEIVTEYREAMLDGAIFPPVTHVFD